VRGPSHTCQRVEQSANPGLERESLSQTNMRTVFHRVSTQASQYTCDRQTRPDETGQCRDSMNNIWQREIEAR